MESSLGQERRVGFVIHAGRVSRCTNQFTWLGHVFFSSQSRPPDIGSGKPAFKSHVLRPTLLEPQEAVPQTLTHSGGARFIAWRLRHPFSGARGISLNAWCVWITALRMNLT